MVSKGGDRTGNLVRALVTYVLLIRINLDLRSVSETIAYLWPLSIIVSSSQSPTRQRCLQ